MTYSVVSSASTGELHERLTHPHAFERDPLHKRIEQELYPATVDTMMMTASSRQP